MSLAYIPLCLYECVGEPVNIALSFVSYFSLSTLWQLLPPTVLEVLGYRAKKCVCKGGDQEETYAKGYVFLPSLLGTCCAASANL